jgi:hypothetical protein
MFTTAVILSLITPTGIAPAEMRDIVANGFAALDRLVVEFEHTTYTAAGDADVRVPANWIPVPGRVPFRHRVTVVRPNLLDEFLTDLPDSGYELCRRSVFNGTYTRASTARDGAPFYDVSQDDVQVQFYRGYPVLQFFDVHLHDSSVSQLNLLRLFDEYDVSLVGDDAEVSSYRTTVFIPVFGHWEDYEFDLNARGTPLRVKSTLRSGTSVRCTIEQFALDTQDLNGAELITDCVFAKRSAPDSPIVGLHHFSGDLRST